MSEFNTYIDDLNYKEKCCDFVITEMAIELNRLPKIGEIKTRAKKLKGIDRVTYKDAIQHFKLTGYKEYLEAYGLETESNESKILLNTIKNVDTMLKQLKDPMVRSYVYTLINGEVVGKYNTVAEASAATGVNRTNIYDSITSINQEFNGILFERRYE